MIKEVHILHRESGVPLIHVHLFDQGNSDDIPSDLFSGVIQAIRLFLKECKIGDLTNFTTQENRIEIKCDKGIVIAVIADINDPAPEVLAIITEDIGAFFVALYENEIESFNGNIYQFEPFESELNEFLQIQFDEKSIDESSVSSFSNIKDKSIKFNPKAKSHLNLLIDWIKNKFDPNAELKSNVMIHCPPDNSTLNIDLLLEGKERNLSRIDKWMIKRIAYGGIRNIIFVLELEPTHGPAQMRQILEKITKLGNPKVVSNPRFYKFFPAEILFIGANIEKSSFNGLEDVIKVYKSEHIIIPEYAHHIHREHSPHHAFFRCKVSGWKWNLQPLSSNNVPQQVYP